MPKVLLRINLVEGLRKAIMGDAKSLVSVYKWKMLTCVSTAKAERWLSCPTSSGSAAIESPFVHWATRRPMTSAWEWLRIPPNNLNASSSAFHQIKGMDQMFYNK